MLLRYRIPSLGGVYCLMFSDQVVASSSRAKCLMNNSSLYIITLQDEAPTWSSNAG